MQNKKKKFPLPLLLLCILLAVTLLLCVAAVGIWYQGQQSLRNEVIAPQFPQSVPKQDTEDEAEAAIQAPIILDNYTIEHNGTRYRYNDSMVNLLLLGIDADEKPDAPLPPASDIQCDVILLAALDLRNQEMTLLSINRDTMCMLEAINAQGESLGYYPAQLALSFSYGDGLEKSCLLTENAVSDLLFGLQIHGYGAFYMGGVAELNDALGGVSITVAEDYPFQNHFWQMVPGQQVTLDGQMARAYIQYRLETEDGNLNRMARQKQYLLAMLSQAMEQFHENPTSVISLYNTVDDYILTDLGLARIVYLASEAASMRFSGDIISLSGTMAVSDDDHMELTLDQQALYQTMLDVFYEKVD